MAAVNRNRQRSFSAMWTNATASRYTPSRHWVVRAARRDASGMASRMVESSGTGEEVAFNAGSSSAPAVDEALGQADGSALKAEDEPARARQLSEMEASGISSHFPLYKPEQPVPPTSSAPPLPPRIKPLHQAISSLQSETEHLRHSLSQQEKLRESEAETAHMQPLTEEELQRFYGALMAHSGEGEVGADVAGLLGDGKGEEVERIGDGSGRGGELVSRKKMRIGKRARRQILTGLMERLQSMTAEYEAEAEEQKPSDENVDLSPGVQRRERIPARVSGAGIIETIRQLTPSPSLPGMSQAEGGVGDTLHTGLIRKVEWEAMLEEFMTSGNAAAVEEALVLMKDHGVTQDASQLSGLLSMYVHRGDVRGLSDLLDRLPAKFGILPDRQQLSTLVDAHLTNGDAYSAVRTLDSFQQSDRVLHQTAYTKVLDALIPTPGRKSLSSTPQQDKAVAWDLLARMRLTAHPRPLVQTYNVMIRACADADDPQPERALDMLVEMDTETNVKPDGATFDAAILACSRVKKFYLEGFRLLGRMLEMHKSALEASQSSWADGSAMRSTEAYASTGYEPTLATFNALLEGCKRRGDLSRARWILAEVVKLIGDGAGQGVDEEMVVNVLQTYAAFKPVVARSDVKTRVAVVKQAGRGTGPSDETEMGLSRSDVSAPDVALELDQSIDTPTSSLLDLASPDVASPVGPQSSTEVLQEADRLFDLVIASQGEPSSPFSTVPLTTRLVNAYLSVQFAHLRLDQALEKWGGIWQKQPLVKAGVRKNGHSYVTAFERCAMAKGDHAKTLVYKIIPGLWQEYLVWLGEAETGRGLNAPKRRQMGLDARHIEKAWVQSIRAHALVNRLIESMSILADFRDRYPPAQIGISSPSPSQVPVSGFSMSSPGITLEDNVPPHILFHDIDILHHRLVTAGDLQGVGQVKWTCLSYQSALQARRSRRIRNMTQGTIRRLVVETRPTPDQEERPSS